MYFVLFQLFDRITVQYRYQKDRNQKEGESMKGIGKLCASLLCLAMVSVGCAGTGAGDSDQSKNPAETAAESVSKTDPKMTSEPESVDEGKEILSRNPQDEVTFTFDYDPSDYLKLDGDYRQIVFSAEDLEVSEDAVQNQVDSLLAEHAELEEVTDRGALAGDTLQIDFTGTMDEQVIYDEKDYQMELGYEGLLPGFEEQLEGAMAGDEISMDLEYPEDYGDEMLNGRTVHFDVTVHKVYLSVVPDYTDEFVKKYAGYDTTAAYEAALKEILADSAKTDAVALWLDEHAVMESCPDSLKEKCEQRMLDFLELWAEYEGTDMEGLLKEMGYDSEEDLLAAEDNANSILADERDTLAYEYVAAKEELKSTVKDYVDFMEKYALDQGYVDAGELLDYYSEEEMRMIYMKKMVTDRIMQYAEAE